MDLKIQRQDFCAKHPKLFFQWDIFQNSVYIERIERLFKAHFHGFSIVAIFQISPITILILIYLQKVNKTYRKGLVELVVDWFNELIPDRNQAYLEDCWAQWFWVIIELITWVHLELEITHCEMIDFIVDLCVRELGEWVKITRCEMIDCELGELEYVYVSEKVSEKKGMF